MSEDQDASTAAGWEEQIIGDRMAVDQQFSTRVNESSLSNQSWELVMMAAEFEITGGDDPDQAKLLVNLDRLENVLPAIDEVETTHGRSMEQGGSRGGLLDQIKGLFGSGGGGEQYRQDAESLAHEYAQSLQRHLEDKGRWEQIVDLAHADASDDRVEE